MAMLRCYYSQYRALSNCPRNVAFPQPTQGGSAFAGCVCNWEPSPLPVGAGAIPCCCSMPGVTWCLWLEGQEQV